MLPPSKRFKMENRVPVQQNGIENPPKGTATQRYTTLHNATQRHTTNRQIAAVGTSNTATGWDKAKGSDMVKGF